MKDKSLIFHVLEIIFLTLGIFLIVVNITSLSIHGEMFKRFEEGFTVYNFHGWHESEPVKFHGFSWFFNRISQCPIFYNLRELITYISSLGYDMVVNFDVSKLLLTLLNVVFFPFVFIGAIIQDIIGTVIWLYGFIQYW